MGINISQTIIKRTYEEVNDKRIRAGIECPLFCKRGIYYNVIGDYENTAIYCYGIGDIMYNNFILMKELSNRLKINIVLFDYPGMGISKGIINESNYNLALDIVINETRPTILVGFSLGTGVVLSYLENYPNEIKKIVLIAAYSSLTKVVNSGTIFEMVMDSVINFHHKSFYNIQNVTAKILLCYSDNDEVIDLDNARILYKNAKNANVIIYKDAPRHCEFVSHIINNIEPVLKFLKN